MEIVKLEIRIPKPIPLELRKRSKKNEQNLWNKKKGVTFVPSKPQKERRKVQCLKNNEIMLKTS